MLQRALALLVIVSLCSLPAAADVGWIAGASGGQSKLNDFRLSTTTLEDDDTVWMLVGGYQFTPYFLLVGGYTDLGSYHAEGPDFGGYVNDIEIDGTYLRAVGKLPLGSQFSILGSVGGLYWDYDFKSEDALEPPRHLTDTGFSPSVGIGVNFDIIDTPADSGFNLHAGWERLFKVGNRDTVEHENDYDVILLGLTYNFTK
jgi:hypothetical protein